MRTSKFVSHTDAHSANLRLVWSHVLPADRDTGMRWYPTAREIMAEWAFTYDVPLRTVACVTAALSPQLEWSRNIVSAEDVLAQRPLTIRGALNRNVDKARAILRDRAETLDGYFTDRAPKVRAFAENLAGNAYRVTIDTHAVQAATLDPTWVGTMSTARYMDYAITYAMVANSLALAPADFQAVIWCTWRRMYPRASKLHLKRTA